jgi:hypothetical protein
MLSTYSKKLILRLRCPLQGEANWGIYRDMDMLSSFLVVYRVQKSLDIHLEELVAKTYLGTKIQIEAWFPRQPLVL